MRFSLMNILEHQGTEWKIKQKIEIKRRNKSKARENKQYLNVDTSVACFFTSNWLQLESNRILIKTRSIWLTRCYFASIRENFVCFMDKIRRRSCRKGKRTRGRKQKRERRRRRRLDSLQQLRSK